MMARPTKSTIDYFPHYIKSGKTLFVLESDFGNDGYAFWFKLLETLGGTDGMYFDWNTPADRRFLLSKTRVDEDKALDIMQALVDVDAIDRELWEKHRVIWCQKLVDNVQDAFRRRSNAFPKRPVFDADDTETALDEVIDDKNPVQSELLPSETGKVKERKEKGKGNIYADIIKYLNQKAGKNFSHKSKANQRLISGRVSEGRTSDDFRYVIDTKVSHWLDDPKMNEYLRPATLFSQKNFENYLNQKPRQEDEAPPDIRDKEIEFAKWQAEGKNPDEFDWS